jgi:hypothetical protein
MKLVIVGGGRLLNSARQDSSFGKGVKNEPLAAVAAVDDSE